MKKAVAAWERRWGEWRGIGGAYIQLERDEPAAYGGSMSTDAQFRFPICDRGGLLQLPPLALVM